MPRSRGQILGLHEHAATEHGLRLGHHDRESDVDLGSHIGLLAQLCSERLAIYRHDGSYGPARRPRGPTASTGEMTEVGSCITWFHIFAPEFHSPARPITFGTTGRSPLERIVVTICMEYARRQAVALRVFGPRLSGSGCVKRAAYSPQSWRPATFHRPKRVLESSPAGLEHVWDAGQGFPRPHPIEAHGDAAKIDECCCLCDYSACMTVA